MLKVLPSNISNLIAAGEVVSRPASAVKELMENAVDAGASTVSVIVTDAGRTLLQVIDDGCGMSPEEAALCFERHATSKISEASDLDHITTLGFRGEALASIAAVAEVTLRTRRAEDEVGSCTVVAASEFVSQTPAATPKGSNFEIRNIFYTVPARRKFLKSDSAELNHIISEFTRVALVRFNVAFRLTSNGRDIYNLNAARNVKQRICDIFGREMTGRLAELSASTSIVNVSGFIGDPQDAHKKTGRQFLFINGRYFRSPYLHKAICRPYEKLIPEGSTPTYFIFLETEADKVDVNIHPAKTEIKFEDESLVFDILTASVREALGKNSMIPSIDFDTRGVTDIPTIQSTRKDSENGGWRGNHENPGNYGGYGDYNSPPHIDFNPLFDPFKSTGYGTVHAAGQGDAAAILQERLFEEERGVDTPGIQLNGKYLFTLVSGGVMVVNIARARERIFYERYIESLAEGQPLRQQALFPQTVKLGIEDYNTIISDLERVDGMGFDIRDFGDNSVVVYGIPEGYSTDKSGVDRIVEDLVTALEDDDVTSDLKTTIAARMAKSAAASRSGSLSASEAHSLVDALLNCREPQLTPGGKRCFIVVSCEELDRKI